MIVRHLNGITRELQQRLAKRVFELTDPRHMNGVYWSDLSMDEQLRWKHRAQELFMDAMEIKDKIDSLTALCDEHRIEESVAVNLRATRDGWVVEASELGSYNLNPAVDSGPRRENCTCGNPAECEQARQAAHKLKLPDLRELQVAIAKAIVDGPPKFRYVTSDVRAEFKTSD
uniref:hypothetical protein n=1 Tax=Amycolatopsis sp. CA-290885 TaxID=3239925 RepID=UPI003F497492